MPPKLNLHVPIERFLQGEAYEKLGASADIIYERAVGLVGAVALEHFGINLGGRFDSKACGRALVQAMELHHVGAGSQERSLLLQAFEKDVRDGLIERFGPSEFNWVSPTR